MIITEISQYLQSTGRAALVDLSHRFDSDPDALRGMLSTLVRKGRVRKLPAGSACGGGCCKCDPASVEIYEWVG